MNLDIILLQLGIVLRAGVNSNKRRVLINGGTKTGTTWMLKMVTSVPGYYISSGYNFRGDIQRYNEVLPGEVIHGHDPYSDELWEILSRREIKVILMVRDPRDQAVSLMYHIERDSSHPQHNTFMELDKAGRLSMCIGTDSSGFGGVSRWWHTLTKPWTDDTTKAICIRYEDLSANTYQELSKAFRHVGIPANNVLTRSIVKRNRFERLSRGRKIWQSGRVPGKEDKSSHYRKGIVGDWRNHFTDEHKRAFKEVNGDALIQLGYEKDFDW